MLVCRPSGPSSHPSIQRQSNQYAATRGETDGPVEESRLWKHLLDKLGEKGGKGGAEEDDEELELVQTEQVRRLVGLCV